MPDDPLADTLDEGEDAPRATPRRGGGRISRSIPVPRTAALDETAEVTGVGLIEARMHAAIADRAPVPPEWQALVDAIVVEVAQRTAEQRARDLAAGDRLPGRVRELEAGVASIAAWRLALTGVADTNGRIGRIEARIPDTVEERLAERATIRSIRWTAAKVLAAFGLAATIAGGGIWQTIETREERARLAGKSEQHEAEQDRRLDRCDPPPRSTPP